eukprot:TRINITY_DN1712_c0_g1_i1.p2 TRINITY_DN1712_c0_g1~~TRINITY_DN1712_c0_g1_i1.p2  ORF type:complete len:112 (+),score=7.85 TRINITY_DN1712_c0_g1_i1:254-589(+)
MERKEWGKLFQEARCLDAQRRSVDSESNSVHMIPAVERGVHVQRRSTLSLTDDIGSNSGPLFRAAGRKRTAPGEEDEQRKRSQLSHSVITSDGTAFTLGHMGQVLRDSGNL